MHLISILKGHRSRGTLGLGSGLSVEHFDKTAPDMATPAKAPVEEPPNRPRKPPVEEPGKPEESPPPPDQPPAGDPDHLPPPPPVQEPPPEKQNL